MRLLEEIFRKRINEEIEEVKKTILIGDSIAYFLSINLNQVEPILVNKPEEKEFNTKTLSSQLQTEEPNDNIKNVILSIGSYDYFSSINQISLLCDIIFDLYPNAEYFVVEGYLEPELIYEFEDSEIDDLEKQRFDYYKEFYNNGFKVIESGDLFASEATEAGCSKILDLINEIDTFIDTDPDFIEKKDKEVITKNVDTDKNDDETDFDTIYEFLNRFQKIVKSNNVYSASLSSKSYDPDVHQIEIALRFLLTGSVGVFDADGIFDKQTEQAIKTYQRVSNLDSTGVADPETLDALYFDLMAHSFDSEDLSQFMESQGVEIFKKKVKTFQGTVDSVWKGFTDKIIENFEGGYWNKDRTKPNSEKCMNHPYDPMYDNSGETMFGIDRRAGGWDNDSAGREFFGLIDDEKENAGSMEEFCKTWVYGYKGGDLKEDLKLRAAALMKTSYDRNSRYFSSKAKEKVESHKRLLFHFAYACWNGSGHFQDFANDINRAVDNGLTDDELVQIAVDGRNRKFGGGDWSRANKKVVDTIQNDPELEN
jgi:peptidoglycan hydrolase-like protein with peptidoglycan-binding domain